MNICGIKNEHIKEIIFIQILIVKILAVILVIWKEISNTIKSGTDPAFTMTFTQMVVAVVDSEILEGTQRGTLR